MEQRHRHHQHQQQQAPGGTAARQAARRGTARRGAARQQRGETVQPGRTTSRGRDRGGRLRQHDGTPRKSGTAPRTAESRTGTTRVARHARARARGARKVRPPQPTSRTAWNRHGKPRAGRAAAGRQQGGRQVTGTTRKRARQYEQHGRRGTRQQANGAKRRHGKSGKRGAVGIGAAGGRRRGGAQVVQVSCKTNTARTAVNTTGLVERQNRNRRMGIVGQQNNSTNTARTKTKWNERARARGIHGRNPENLN